MSYIKSKKKELIQIDWLVNEFKSADDFQDFKKTLTNLNYIFYGAMLTAVAMVLYQLFSWYGPYWLLVPLAYILVCYLGRVIHSYISNYNTSPVVEDKPVKRKAKVSA